MTIDGATIVESVRPAPGGHFVRRFEVDGADAFSILAGPGTVVRAAEGATHTWTDGRLRVASQAPRVVIELEVTP